MGIKVGGMRLPLIPATPAETEKIKACLQNSGII
jgi:dihydrodipicolinate synthase/N-acetylneuraminate lyase